MKTETDKEIVASNDARRRLKLRAMKEARVKMGTKENYDDKKEGEKGMRCKNLCKEEGKKPHTCTSMNTSVGVQNRVTIWTISGRDT